MKPSVTIRIPNRLISRFLFVITLFCILYNPPIVKGLSFTTLFSMLSFIDNIICWPRTKSIISKLKRPLRILAVFIVLYVLVCVVNSFTNTEYSRRIYSGCFSTMTYIVAQMSVSVFIVRRGKRLNIENDELITCFLLVGVFQGVLGLLCYVSPGIKASLNSLMAHNSDDIKFAAKIEFNSYRRNFGFASTLFDIFGCTMSMLSILAFCRAFINRRRLDYLAFVVITFVAVLNARTSFILIGIGIILVFVLTNTGSRFSIFHKIAAAIIALIVSVCVIERIKSSSTESSIWLASGIEEIRLFLTGTQTGYFQIFSRDGFLFFPDGFLSVLFGTSLTPMILINRNTDIGYIQNIWLYGIVGTIIICASWISFGKCAILNYKAKNTWEHVYIKCLLIVIFVYQIKLNTWGYSMAGVVYYTVFMSMACSNDSELICD